MMNTISAYPVLLLCGCDLDRRELMKVHDPQGKLPSKALLPMAGKRVLDWQIEALIESPDISDIYIIGLSPEEFPSDQDLTYIPFNRNSSILEKIKYGSNIILEAHPDLQHVVVCSGDAPGMTVASITQFFEILRQNLDADVLFGVVPEEITLKYFPIHNRVIGKFKDQSVYPGEMNGFRHRAITILEHEIHQLTITRRQFDRRKDTSKLLPVLRYLAEKPQLWPMIFKYSTGLLTISETESILSRVYNLKMKAAIIPDPGFGMDLDLPEDYERLSEFIQKTKLQSS